MILEGGIELINNSDVLKFYNDLINNYVPPKEKKIS